MVTSDAQHTITLSFVLTLVAAMVLPAGMWEQAKFALQSAATVMARFKA